MNWPAWYDAGLVAQLADVPLGTRRVPIGVAEGRHPSRLPGAGIEFAQYRGYQPGDDVRRVDWKLLARSDRLYVREADAETALPVLIVVDATASMLHSEAGFEKFDRARAIAAALVKSAIRHGDLPALIMLQEDGIGVNPSRDHRQFERIIDAMDRTSPKGRWPSDGAGRIAELGFAGPAVAISDGHDPGETLINALSHASSDATILALRTPREEDLDYGEAVTLEDLETGERVTLSPGLSHGRAGDDLVWVENATSAGVSVEFLNPCEPLNTPIRTWLASRSGRR